MAETSATDALSRRGGVLFGPAFIRCQRRRGRLVQIHRATKASTGGGRRFRSCYDYDPSRQTACRRPRLWGGAAAGAETDRLVRAAGLRRAALRPRSIDEEAGRGLGGKWREMMKPAEASASRATRSAASARSARTAPENRDRLRGARRAYVFVNGGQRGLQARLSRRT